MAIKKQLLVLKENWLLVVLGLVVVLFLTGGGNFVSQELNNLKSYSSNDLAYGGVAERATDGIATSYYPSYGSDNFAPEVQDRKITKTASLSTEVERGEFKSSEERLKNIVTSSGAYLLSDNSNRYGEGWKGYYSGYYSLKVESEKYDSVVSQLKEIGEVQSFNENADDVTGRYEDLSVEIEVEKARLARYQEMYDSAKDVSDKIDLSDRIFDEERRIKYLEDSLRNVDNRVEYSTISFSMSEERSSWVGIAIVGVSDLVKGFVSSLNSLLSFVFVVLPWGLVVWIGFWIWKRVGGE